MINRCLIVDDESPARELIASHIAKLDGFEIADQFGSAIDAFSYLQKNSVDLMFLDIQMPGMDGLELVRSLHNPPGIILATAHREYAPEAFDLDVLDYLVKPISLKRFMKAVDKYYQYFKTTSGNSLNGKTYLFLKVEGEQVKVFFNDIRYIEGMKDYIKVVTGSNTYITHDRLKNMEKKLPKKQFVRVHKSYIISTEKVEAFTCKSVKVRGKEISIGQVYKQNFQDVFSNI